jgi:hypothetical protein
MFHKPLPRWSVTWPTRPEGVYTVFVRATSATHAVDVAANQYLPVTVGYAMAFDYEPEVWRLRHPYRYRSHHVAGPELRDLDDAAPFVPEPYTAGER